MIDATNVGDVVKAGVWTWADICTGAVANTQTCKDNAAQ